MDYHGLVSSLHRKFSILISEKKINARTFLLSLSLSWLVRIVRLLGSLRISLRHFFLILSKFYLKVRKECLVLRTTTGITKEYYNIYSQG